MESAATIEQGLAGSVRHHPERLISKLTAA
jgi:hypothetical protein